MITVAIVCLLPGCASKKPPAWTPRPIVRWEDIATEAFPPAENGYRVLTQGPTRGLFPAALAVSRVSVVEGEAEGAREPHLLTDPRNEFLQWNSAFDDLMAVSEVFPIAERTLGGGEAEPRQILAAFRALHARLGLIYAVNEASEQEAEMIAVLYDLAAARPLACFHARSESLPLPTKRDARKTHSPWNTDARALVRAKFEKLAHACLRELTLADMPAGLEDKSGWTHEFPPRPVEWPPRKPPPGTP